LDYNSENCVQRTSVAQLLFTEVPVPGQEIDPTCIYVLDVSILPLFLRFPKWIVAVPDLPIGSTV